MKTLWEVLSGVLSFFIGAILVGGTIAIVFMGGAFFTLMMSAIAVLGVVGFVAWGIWEILTGKVGGPKQ